MTSVINEAPRHVSDPLASARESAEVCKRLLGISRANYMTLYAAALRTSATNWRVSGNPTTDRYAEQLRIRLREARHSVVGEARQRSAELWASIDARGLPRDTSRQSWADSLTQLQKLLIFIPAAGLGIPERRAKKCDSGTAGSEAMARLSGQKCTPIRCDATRMRFGWQICW